MSEIKQTQDRLEKIVAAKFRHPEITDLDDLINVLQEIDEFNDRHLDDVPNTFGEVGDKNSPPIAYNDLVSDLPVFGIEPDNTEDIWSYDNERLLVSNWSGEKWELVDRKEWEGLDDQS